MSRQVLGLGAPVALGGLAAAAALLFTNLDRALVLDLLLVYLGAVSLHALARSTGAATRTGGASAFEATLGRRPATAARPERLVRIQGLVSLATATAGDFHHGLRPTLREAAAHALSARDGVDLRADPARAAAALGEEAWRLVGEERPPPGDRYARGPSLAALSRTVEAIERIAP